MTHFLRRVFEFVSPSHHALHAVSFLWVSKLEIRAHELTDSLALTPPKGTNRTLPSLFKTVNGPPKDLQYLQYGFLQICVMGTRHLQIP